MGGRDLGERHSPGETEHYMMYSMVKVLKKREIKDSLMIWSCDSTKGMPLIRDDLLYTLDPHSQTKSRRVSSPKPGHKVLATASSGPCCNPSAMFSPIACEAFVSQATPTQLPNLHKRID